MSERRVFARGTRRFEVVVVSTARLKRRRRKVIRRLADRRQLPSTIARALGITVADVLAVLSTPDRPDPMIGGLFDAWR